MAMMSTQLGAVPDHVPQDLVVPYDFVAGENMQSCPHAMLARLQQGPRLFFNSSGQNPDGSMGFWVPTRAEDLRHILQHPDIYSSHQIARYSSLLGESWPLIPAEVDPPDHTAYRKFLNPLFSPSAVKAMEPAIRRHAVSLIDRALADKQCDFATAFAKPFPIIIFLTMMGLPLEAFEDIVRWGHDLHEGSSLEQRARGGRAIGEFLGAELARASATPRDDIISRIANGEIDGRKLNDDEIMGMTFLVFAGGIHTVTASLGFQCLHLARTPELQRELRDDVTKLPAAIEEMLRVYAVVNSFRRVTQDHELAGVLLRRGDWLLNSLPIANYDPDEFEDAAVPDTSRKPNRHMTFSFGPHFCLGAHLARSEMRIAWSEWLTRAPPFVIADDSATEITSGTLLGVNRLLIEWN
ncbi:cytochrome P450 [Sphingopyxis sp.]|uniref:cytochrome P450 n=1 Tax=Sphingopyxis sp. TaxID=1908224 RepID=UPI003D6C8750